MASQGKHAKTNTSSSSYGKHAGAVNRKPDLPQLAVSIFLLALIAIVPFSINRIIVNQDVSTSIETPAAYGVQVSDVSQIATPEQIIESYHQGFVEPIVVEQPDKTTIVAAPVDYNLNVSEKLQNEVMPGGCEFISLDIVFNAMDLDADIHNVVADYLDIDGHFATGYSGDPYELGGGYPAGIAEAANEYLKAQKIDAQAIDLTGISFEELTKFVQNGYPVLVWTTMNYEDPVFTGAFDNGVEWYSNEHCVVLYATKDNVAYVSDPLEGKIEVPLNRFSELFYACGSMAVVVAEESYE